MQIKILKSKLHQATVTGSALHYHGSLTVDVNLLEAVGLRPFEAVLVSNLATGNRGETYVLPGGRGSGRIELNGAMAPWERWATRSSSCRSPGWNREKSTRTGRSSSRSTIAIASSSGSITTRIDRRL